MAQPGGVSDASPFRVSGRNGVPQRAGRHYRRPLIGSLREMTRAVSVPVEGLGIGEPLRFLSEQT